LYGYEVPVQNTDGEGPERVRELVRETYEVFEIRIVKEVMSQKLRTHDGELSADDGKRDHEAEQGAHVENLF
jgi:hypothetical protein